MSEATDGRQFLRVEIKDLSDAQDAARYLAALALRAWLTRDQEMQQALAGMVAVAVDRLDPKLLLQFVQCLLNASTTNAAAAFGTLAHLAPSLAEVGVDTIQDAADASFERLKRVATDSDGGA